MKSSSELCEPKLAPPGAGIPFPQKLFLRFLVKPLVAHRQPWEHSEEKFKRISAKIEKEIVGLSEMQLENRVLVPPLRGLEDSSRYWSIAMTLEHLCIVGTQITALVRALDAGIIPPGEADTAKVKPDKIVQTKIVLEKFRFFTESQFPALLPSLKREHASPRFRHQWFGPLNSRGWYWLLATHQAVHLAQIREIKKAL